MKLSATPTREIATTVCRAQSVGPRTTSAKGTGHHQRKHQRQSRDDKVPLRASASRHSPKRDQYYDHAQSEHSDDVHKLARDLSVPEELRGDYRKSFNNSALSSTAKRFSPTTLNQISQDGVVG